MFENPYAKLLLVPIVIGVLLFGGLFVSMKCQSRRIERLVREAEEGGPPADLSTPGGRLDYASRIEYENSAESVRITTEIADGPDAALAAKARDLLPRRLSVLYSYSSRSEWAKAEGALRELEKRFPASPERAQVAEQWQRDRRYAAEAAARKGDFPNAERLFRECLKDAGGEAEWDLISAWQKMLAERAAKWGDPVAAERDIEEAASWHIEPRAHTDFARELSRRGGAKLLEKAKALLASGRPVPALGFAQAANLGFLQERNREGAEESEAFLVECCLAVARKMRDEPVPTIPLQAYERFWEVVAQGTRVPATKVEALDELAYARRDAGLAALRKGDLDRAESKFRETLLFTLTDWWMTRAEAEPGFDPFAGFPAALEPEIEKASSGSKDAGIRRECLRGLMHDGRWTAPHLAAERIRGALPELYAKIGAKLIGDRRFGEAEWRLRGAIRADAKGPAARACVATLEEGVRKAAAAKDLTALVWLTGFYVAELGPPRAAFAEEFRSAVTAAADGLKGSPIQRIFMLSILCDAFPDSKESASARDEILSVGIDFAKKAPEHNDGPGLDVPTGLKDVAAASIENATPYHIFVFYDGPERFFVRLNPYWKGTVLMKPGAYVVGVVAPDETIRPYHARKQVEAHTYWAQYVVVQEGEKSRNLLGSGNSTGEYALVRGLTGVRVTLDPGTGLVTPPK